tara:strand:- start:22026 stop:22262 length:237 start_codon:yes stop_codon:yes gene_type:complete
MCICRSNAAEAPSQSPRIEFLHTKQIDIYEFKVANQLFFIDYFVHTTSERKPHEQPLKHRKQKNTKSLDRYSSSIIKK